MSVDLELPQRAGRVRRVGRADAPDRADAAGRAGWRLSGRPAMYLLASLIVSLLAASAAPTPLYAIYQAHWGSRRSPRRSCSGCTRSRSSPRC
jgi:hypothetical protein